MGSKRLFARVVGRQVRDGVDVDPDDGPIANQPDRQAGQEDSDQADQVDEAGRRTAECLSGEKLERDSESPSHSLTLRFRPHSSTHLGHWDSDLVALTTGHGRDDAAALRNKLKWIRLDTLGTVKAGMAEYGSSCRSAYLTWTYVPDA
ncbi:hypothetical protein A1Q1_03549 [Trichosporon asahii var. asahii CBS 2479]|uniref:Uncharacterized protein n=1 Tax=Trichosporon asahii var. asahii (strain ATCC 90039 / CBS 2479 / JCM 2466 / KCTC 7840 / NBRC 103889/ NCYC 2677 / UAMH 7654) TaxID=1186058 RepID=J5SUE6_TRIAS|nr:hypothetical protein A1Q1_03549 [Trichosporon asahii var. asahii CBS 2479]EJT47576.1 hypothetical protein A1Q1_03549 [Trichosporon asahii var. asahii CBS 2479]